MGLPIEVAAQESEPPVSGGPDPTLTPPSPDPPTGSLKLDIRGGVALSVLGSLVHAVGSGVVGYGYAATLVVGGPLDYEHHRSLIPCCQTLMYLTPGFLAVASGGMMLGYGADYAFSNGWTLDAAKRSIRSSRRGLIISATLLGATVALHIVSAAVYGGAWSEVIRTESGDKVTETGKQMLTSGTLGILASLLLALPTGVSTGVYLNRYLRDRFLLERGPSERMRGPIGVSIAPILSPELYGLRMSGRF